jgi:hypothetical protein
MTLHEIEQKGMELKLFEFLFFKGMKAKFHNMKSDFLT